MSVKNFFANLKKAVGFFGLACFCLGIISILFMSVFGDDYDPSIKALVTLAFYIVVSLLSAVIITIIALQKNESNFSTDQDKSSLTDILGEMDIPIAVFKSDETILWTNKAFRDASGFMLEEAKALNLHSFTSLVSDALVNRSEGVLNKLSDKTYIMKGYYISSGKGKTADSSAGKKLVLVWRDISEILSLKAQLSSEQTLVANILIDNLDELVQFTGVSSQSVINSVEKKLSVWASSVGGLLKEYQRSRYLFMFESKHLKEFSDNKFEILEEIRKIRFGESRMPVTISIGISDAEGTLADKMKSSSEYLEAALQRGGDQVAVKIEENVRFYGGVTKSIQSVNKTKARVMATRVRSYMADASSILIMGHKNADYDSFGACIAVAKLARSLGVPAKIIINERDSNIQKCLAKAKALPEYADIFINREEALNRIDSQTLLMIVDVNNVYCFESREVYENVKDVIFIDHHRLDKKFEPGFEPLMTFIDTSASSTCEIFSEFLEELIEEDDLSNEEADMIYAGIAVDSKKFTVNAGAKTFSAAMYLRKCGADPMRVNKELFSTDIKEITMLSGFQTDVHIYCSIAVISLNRRTDLTDEDDKYAAMAADTLLTLEGICASFTVCMINNKVRIKARSNGKLNVQLVLEQLGGGGHFDQAATVLTDTSLESACKALKEAIDNEIKRSDLSETLNSDSVVKS